MFIDIDLEITIAIHAEMAKLEKHIVIQSCKERAKQMKKLRKSLIEMQLALLESKKVIITYYN